MCSFDEMLCSARIERVLLTLAGWLFVLGCYFSAVMVLLKRKKYILRFYFPFASGVAVCLTICAELIPAKPSKRFPDDYQFYSLNLEHVSISDIETQYPGFPVLRLRRNYGTEKNPEYYFFWLGQYPVKASGLLQALRKIDADGGHGLEYFEKIYGSDVLAVPVQVDKE